MNKSHVTCIFFCETKTTHLKSLSLNFRLFSIDLMNRFKSLQTKPHLKRLVTSKSSTIHSVRWSNPGFVNMSSNIFWIFILQFTFSVSFSVFLSFSEFNFVLTSRLLARSTTYSDCSTCFGVCFDLTEKIMFLRVRPESCFSELS